MTFQFVNDGVFRTALEYDKLAHMGGSCLVVCALYVLLQIRYMKRDALYVAWAWAVGLGFVLELYQGFTGIGFSPLDLIANWIGIFVAVQAVRRG